jgi:DNA replication licensing factor MCM2
MDFKNLKRRNTYKGKKNFSNKIYRDSIELKKAAFFLGEKKKSYFLSGNKKRNLSLNNLKKWLKLKNNRNFVKHRFLCFLFGTLDEKYGSNFYIEKLKKIFSFEKQNLIVSFLHLVISDPLLAIWLIDEPREILLIFQESCNDVFKNIYDSFFENQETIFVRVFELPVFDSIMSLKGNRVNSLVKIRGTVVSKTNIYPHLRFFKLFCLKCFELQKSVYTFKENKKILHASCFNCKGQGPFQISWSQSEYLNFQKISVQELDKFNAISYIPFSKEIILKNNLVDFVKLGDEIIVTGILTYNFDPNIECLSNSKLFSTIIEANYIEKPKGLTHNFLFEIKEEKILNLVFKKKKILDYLLFSLVPSVYFYEEIKLPILFSLFGKQNLEIGSKFRIRNNINVLIIGDSGTGKSQILKGLENFLPKSILVTGSCSTKNLNSSLKYKKYNNDWILEGGAFVCTDKGFCLIDEIEKLHPKEYLFLNKVIDQQYVTISKKGIYEFVKTRCSFIVTTNPSNGIYEPTLSLLKNSFLGEKFLSKFDVHLILKDNVDSSNDEFLGNLILKSHIINHSSYVTTKYMKDKMKNLNPKSMESNKTHSKKYISQKLFKKYIIYARQCIKPTINLCAQELISKFYILLRKQNFSDNSMKLTLRHLETILRLSNACTKLHLREKTNNGDALKAISVFLKFFVESQPIKFCKILKSKFKKYLYPYESTFKNLLNILVNFFLQKAILKGTIEFLKKKKFENKLKKLSVDKTFITKFFQSKIFFQSGFKLDKNQNVIFYVG